MSGAGKTCLMENVPACRKRDGKMLVHQFMAKNGGSCWCVDNIIQAVPKGMLEQCKKGECGDRVTGGPGYAGPVRDRGSDESR